MNIERTLHYEFRYEIMAQLSFQLIEQRVTAVVLYNQLMYYYT